MGLQSTQRKENHTPTGLQSCFMRGFLNYQEILPELKFIEFLQDITSQYKSDANN